MTESSKQFERITIEVGKTAPAYMAYMAIWQRGERPHVVIAAPTLDALEDQWDRITSTELDRSQAQKVFICHVEAASNTGGES